MKFMRYPISQNSTQLDQLKTISHEQALLRALSYGQRKPPFSSRIRLRIQVTAAGILYGKRKSCKLK